MPETTDEDEVDAAQQILLSAGHSASEIRSLRLHIVRALCERLSLPVLATRKSQAVRDDYTRALLLYVCLHRSKLHASLT